MSTISGRHSRAGKMFFRKRKRKVASSLEPWGGSSGAGSAARIVVTGDPNVGRQPSNISDSKLCKGRERRKGSRAANICLTNTGTTATCARCSLVMVVIVIVSIISLGGAKGDWQQQQRRPSNVRLGAEAAVADQIFTELKATVEQQKQERTTTREPKQQQQAVLAAGERINEVQARLAANKAEPANSYADKAEKQDSQDDRGDEYIGWSESSALAATKTEASKPKKGDLSSSSSRPLSSAALWLERAGAHHHQKQKLLEGDGRHKRSIEEPKETREVDSTRIVAVAGQWIELQCPLASEMLAAANVSSAPNSPSHPISRLSGQPTIEWRKNGAKMGQLSPRQKINALNGSLVIVFAQPKLDEASYECALVQSKQQQSSTANNNNNSPGAQKDLQHQGDHLEEIKSHRFDLKLVVPPRLAPFEFPAGAQVGMKVVLTCSVLEGQQPISFVWLKDNQIINADNSHLLVQAHHPHHHHAGTNANSLSQLHQQQLADKFALTSGGGAGNSGQLSLFGQQSKSPSSEYVIIGDSSTPTGSSSSEALENGQQLLALLSDSNIRIRQADDYSILSIDKLELKHSGRYTCSVQNEAARASHSSQLVINAPPTLTIEPKDGDLVSGQSTVIDCAASGQPRPTISWLRARESSSKLWDYVPVYDSLRYMTLPNGSLAIANATQREQGYYLCSAKNGFGPEVTRLIKITVHEPAKFSAKYKTVEVRIEEKANIVCVAAGELPIVIEWFDKDGSQIRKNDKKFIIDNEPYDSKPNEQVNATVSRLIIARSGRSDSGQYSCQATNKHGADKMVTNLLVQDVPDKVIDLKVTNVTASTISIRWQLAFSGNSPVTSYLVQYQSDDPLDDLLMSPALGVLPLPPSATAGGGKSASSAGDGVGGGSGSGLSSVAANGDSQRSSQQQQQMANSATSSLRAALDALNIASSLENADEAIDRTLVELTVEQSSTHLVVKDLSPYCVYRLRLAGINKIGLGEFSEWIRAKTEEAPPSGTALKIQAAATGPNSIKLSWSPPDRRSWNGQLVGFNIGYRPIDSSFELNKTVEWTPPSLQSIWLDVDKQSNSRQLDPASASPAGLLSAPAASSTSATAATTTSALTKTLSKSVQYHVLALSGALQQAAGNKQSGSASTSASANSSTSSGSTSNNEQQQQQQQQGHASQSQYILRQHLRQLLALQQQELVAHLTNLQRSTTYLVWIQALNLRGFGPQSHAITIKTLDDVPPSAPAIKVQSTSPNSITIAWSMLSNFVSPANQYSLFYRRVPQQQQQQQQQQIDRLSLFGSSASNSSKMASTAPDGSSQSDLQAAEQFLLGGPSMQSQLFEPGPFIERTMNSQQLMLSGNMFAFSDTVGAQQMSPDQQAVDLLTKGGSSYMHQQAQQHYQQFVYTLDQLECGSAYELYMTTRNSVGKSEPSAVVTTRTLGEPPLAPANKNTLFARIGTHEVGLNMASWMTGGCPITHATLRYKQAPVPVASVSTGSGSQPSLSGSSQSNSSAPAPGASSSSQSSSSHQSLLSVSWPITTSLPGSLLASINNQQQQQYNLMSRPIYAGDQQQQQQASLNSAGDTLKLPADVQPIYTLKNLLPGTCYDLEIIAHNAAGHTMAQFEFVTANLNGTRGGYSRREGVFRIDQRGASLDQQLEGGGGGNSRSSLLEQQASFANGQSGSTSGQLIPLLLMIVCFVCLVVSSTFCYYRLADSWKRHTSNRRGSSDTSATGATCSLAGGQRQAMNSSPSSIGKASSVWRSNGGHLHHQQATLKRQHHHHHHHQQQRANSLADQDSPIGPAQMHLCVRGDQPAGSQLMSATLNPRNTSSSFSQSVSMKDFNLISPPAAATLNFKNYRNSLVRPADSSKAAAPVPAPTLAGTLRNRVSNETAYANGADRAILSGPTSSFQSNTLTHSQICSIYAAACKTKQPDYGSHQRTANTSFGGGDYDHRCQYSALAPEDQQQPETGWSTGNYSNGLEQHCSVNNIKHNPTQYAIPTAANNNYTLDQSPQQVDGTYDAANGAQLAATYGQNSIDACIQQLMSQQYQQQQQQQQEQQQQQHYAMIVNQKPELNNRCLYGQADHLNYGQLPANHQQQQANSNEQQQQLHCAGATLQQSGTSKLMAAAGNNNLVPVGAQSVIDSSSSSSGIDIGNANSIDCASSTATGTSNSNASNNGYQLTGNANGGCSEQEFNGVEDQFPLPPPASQLATNELGAAISTDLKQQL